MKFLCTIGLFIAILLCVEGCCPTSGCRRRRKRSLAQMPTDNELDHRLKDFFESCETTKSYDSVISKNWDTIRNWYYGTSDRCKRGIGDWIKSLDSLHIELGEGFTAHIKKCFINWFNAPRRCTTGRCPKPKVYNSCPKNCPITCNNINNPPRICTTVCRPGVTCVCPRGYVEKSSTDSTCVKPSQCRKAVCNILQCGPYGRCRAGRCICRPNYTLKNGRCVDPCALRICPEGTVCGNGKCVSICRAPKLFKGCSTSCPKTCENRFDRPRPCPAVCRPTVKCVCPAGYVEKSSTDSSCVKESRCPLDPCALKFCPKGTICKDGECVSICPEPKVFKGCSTSCPKTCENRFDPPRPCPTACRPGVKCVCPDGYAERSNTDSTCVKESRCPERCPKPKVYDSCPTNRPATCENINDPPRICATVFRPGVSCVCPRGYVEKSSTDSTCVKRSKCQKVPVCQQPKVTGLCMARISNFFFNARTGKCEKFYYGGCQGNDNRFDSRKECEAACNLCKLDKDVGPCDGDYQRYHYNSDTGDCEEFSYGGCPGNANRFHTLRECRKECADPCILKFCPIGRICRKGQCVKRCGDGYCGDDGVCVFNKCLCSRRPGYSEDCTLHY